MLSAPHRYVVVLSELGAEATTTESPFMGPRDSAPRAYRNLIRDNILKDRQLSHDMQRDYGIWQDESKIS